MQILKIITFIFYKTLSMKRLLTILLMGVPLLHLSAQENTLSTGGEANGSGGSLSFSVGQIAVQYSTEDSISFSEGVQQPFEISLNGVDNYPAIELKAQLYPNPTQWNATLEISDIALIDRGLSAGLYDSGGKLLREVKIVSENTLIELADFSAGTYFLNVRDEKSFMKSFKILKIR